MAQRHTILCVDDDVDDRDMVRNIIHGINKDYEIVEAANGRDALGYLRSPGGKDRVPSLILLDINMPVLDGRETVAIIKSEPETESIPIVILTTSNSHRDKAFFNRFQLEMITKPNTYDELKARLSQVINAHITADNL